MNKAIELAKLQKLKYRTIQQKPTIGNSPHCTIKQTALRPAIKSATGGDDLIRPARPSRYRSRYSSTSTFTGSPVSRRSPDQWKQTDSWVGEQISLQKKPFQKIERAFSSSVHQQRFQIAFIVCSPEKSLKHRYENYNTCPKLLLHTLH